MTVRLNLALFSAHTLARMVVDLRAEYDESGDPAVDCSAQDVYDQLCATVGDDVADEMTEAAIEVEA